MKRKRSAEQLARIAKRSGRKGGLIRASKLTAQQRSDIARKAALARHNRASDQPAD